MGGKCHSFPFEYLISGEIIIELGIVDLVARFELPERLLICIIS